MYMVYKCVAVLINNVNPLDLQTIAFSFKIDQNGRQGAINTLLATSVENLTSETLERIKKRWIPSGDFSWDKLFCYMFAEF